MKNTKFFIKTDERKYPIHIGISSISTAKNKLKFITKNSKNIAFFLDTKIVPNRIKEIIHSLKGKKISIFKITANEKNKNFVIANNLLNGLAKKKFNRSDCVIAVGGGIVGDISGFVASTYKRGMKFINIPTTLLSQADACIGGKTGINSKFGKNLIGNFYQPELIISNTTFLETLPNREIICGYAEMLKHAIIKDKNFFSWLVKHGLELVKKRNKKLMTYAIYKSCKVKAGIVEKDEKEKNLRMKLNFGHTFGHAFEATKKFSKKLNHGEAVLLGMMSACEFSFEKKILSLSDLIKIKKHFLDLNLPHNLKKYFRKRDIKKIIDFMTIDKKNYNDKINLILISKIGKSLRGKIFSKKEVYKFINRKI